MLSMAMILSRIASKSPQMEELELVTTVLKYLDSVSVMGIKEDFIFVWSAHRYHVPATFFCIPNPSTVMT
ncbi:hypothetical protein V6N13_040982 [Hibiscus sabdariffa]